MPQNFNTKEDFWVLKIPKLQSLKCSRTKSFCKVWTQKRSWSDIANLKHKQLFEFGTIVDRTRDKTLLIKCVRKKQRSNTNLDHWIEANWSNCTFDHSRHFKTFSSFITPDKSVCCQWYWTWIFFLLLWFWATDNYIYLIGKEKLPVP